MGIGRPRYQPACRMGAGLKGRSLNSGYHFAFDIGLEPAHGQLHLLAELATGRFNILPAYLPRKCQARAGQAYSDLDHSLSEDRLSSSHFHLSIARLRLIYSPAFSDRLLMRLIKHF